MKRTFLVFFIAVLVLFGRVGALAQEPEHFKFMGISMGLNEKAFVKELKKKGFEPQQGSNGGMFFTGMFRGYMSSIAWSLTPVSKKPWAISVIISVSDWLAGKNQYEKLKGDLSFKYGEPTVVQEDIPYEYIGNELEYVSDKNNSFQTIWQLNNGAIVLLISSFELYGIYHGSVAIDYYDAANRKLEAEERISCL